jgi:hypothetical protein
VSVPRLSRIHARRRAATEQAGEALYSLESALGYAATLPASARLARRLEHARAIQAELERVLAELVTDGGRVAADTPAEWAARRYGYREQSS